MQRTKHGGSEAMPQTPTKADPRSIVARSKVEEDAGLKAMWQGYAFAEDFREERGHFYMLEDQRLTKRQVVVKQPGACVNCHASMYLPYKKAGNGDIVKGFDKINAMPYQEVSKLVTHPVACIDCHDGKTLALRVTRPAFIEGMRVYKASLGVKDYDVNKQASTAEMRAYVCGQCHVEYYFKGPQKSLVYPWAKGLKVEQITAYYDEIGFRDWTHKDTGAPALKAQHPEFETWSQGTHARAGVTCVDCHMPAISKTLTDHWVRSPILNMQAACVACHKKHDAKASAEDLQARVFEIQDRHWAPSPEGDGGGGGADRRPEGGEGGGPQGRGPPRRPLPAAAIAVLPGLRRGGKLHGLPRAAGVGTHPRRIDRLRAPGPARAARPDVQADRSGGRHSAAAAHEALSPHARRSAKRIGRPAGRGSLARTWRRLRSPSARWSVAALVGLGIVLSAIAVIGTQVMVHVTGTDEFCGTACHSMQWVAQEHRESTHGATRTGMRATCHDCHIPREYPELLWYKAVAGTKDVIGEIRGIIDTEEKFLAERKHMAGLVWAEYKDNDSRACRGCHVFSTEVLAKQQEAAQGRPRDGARGPRDLHRLPQRSRPPGALTAELLVHASGGGVPSSNSRVTSALSSPVPRWRRWRSCCLPSADSSAFVSLSAAPSIAKCRLSAWCLTAMFFSPATRASNMQRMSMAPDLSPLLTSPRCASTCVTWSA